ncbi:MAG: aromatic ring-hydroxylating dioxygenase subunit alpha [Proteobacteria bacterium]|nr:aromatic ring-hydroxylating dioxygenase subunit alpha [Pseudomonadota bacterium]
MPDSAARPTPAARIHPDPELSYTIPGHYYYDPAIYAREIDEIFLKTWQFAGYLSDVAAIGDYLTFRWLDQNVLIVRSKDGRLRGFHNVCQHRGHELVAGGNGNRPIFTCPYHAWSYDSLGLLKAAGNAENVKNFDFAEFSLPEVRVEEFAHMVFVNFDEDAPTLTSLAGAMVDEFRAAVPRFDELKLARRDAYEFQANWKFIFDAMECYHCPHIHPQSGYGRKDGFLEPSFEITEFPYWARHVVRGNPDTIAHKPENVPYELDSAPEIKDVTIWWLWPNHFFMTHIGAPNFKVMHATPRSPERSSEILDNFCVNDPPTDKDWAQIDRFRDLSQAQDIAPMEAQQRGIRSRAYTQGRLMVDGARSWRSEHGVHHFHRLVWETLNGPNYPAS